MHWKKKEPERTAHVQRIGDMCRSVLRVVVWPGLAGFMGEALCFGYTSAMIYSSTADAFAVVNNTVSLRWVSLLTRGLPVSSTCAGSGFEILV